MGNIAAEMRTVEKMISLYCRNKHGGKVLCAECDQLKQYALQRLSKCSLGDEKGACSSCPAHCYKTNMREKIQAVMRFSGPRMILYYPMDFVKHLIKK